MFREKAIAMVRAGSPPKTTLRALGCGDSTIRLWTSQSQDLENPTKSGVLWRDLLSAEQEWLAALAEKANGHAIRDGRVCVDMLARRDAEHWARTDTLQVQQTIDIGPVLAQIASAQRQIATGTYVEGEWLEEARDAVQEPGETEGSEA